MAYSVSTAGVAKCNDKYFIAKRKPGKSLGNLWEFPGGKAEKGELPEESLVREFLEEFNVDIRVNNRLCSGVFTNKENTYNLIAFKIDILSEKIELTEHTEYSWVHEDDLSKFKFPESDNIIVNHLLNNGYQ
ncbi:MAG: (deoxy)nucleoside triphosphate pyrophosphohydrolase [Spirochaetaceae bacterium]|nr:(deoxy)nucleoside triphosphate pyrophosphohydrolase [Spirochaetaceae bacterium]